VLAISAGGDADIQLGKFRLHLPIKRLELRQKAVKEAFNTQVAVHTGGAAASPGLELDLRGERVEEGLERLERYLNSASLARLPWVRIIHGKGTGAMREAVREALKRNPLVRDARFGEPSEGGDGVTVARLEES
jgi:DNA mismatch repair protein MutS2